MDGVDRSQNWKAVSDSALVWGMRRARPEAVDEFIRRFGGITLYYARRLGIPPKNCGQWAEEVLFDVALTVAARKARYRVALPRTSSRPAC